MTLPVLIAANYENQFSLYRDASDVGIGAVLTQLCSDDIEHPILFYHIILTLQQNDLEDNSCTKLRPPAYTTNNTD